MSSSPYRSFYLWPLPVWGEERARPAALSITGNCAQYTQCKMEFGYEELLNVIQDNVGAFGIWPQKIKRLFNSAHLKHQDRFELTLFFFSNGLSHELLYAWLIKNNMLRDKAAVDHVGYLWQYFQRDENKNKFYTFDMTNMRWEYLDGKEKCFS